MSDALHSHQPVNEITSVRLRLASPDDIRKWSHGQVRQHDFLREPLDKPHPEGLFSERIFGPLHDWCCGCRIEEQAQYWGPEQRGSVCPRCGVCIAGDDVRRRRFGHIELALPVVHTWLLRARPSPLALLLGLRRDDLNAVAMYQRYLVLSPGDSGLAPLTALTEMEYLTLRGNGSSVEADTGGRAIRTLLQRLDLAQREVEVRAELHGLQRSRLARQLTLSRALEVLGWLKASENRPEWMVLECLPVLPPDLRPVRLAPDGTARFSSDLNVFYGHILRVNDRLSDAIQSHAPRVILRDLGARLQRAVDALFDNAHCESPLTGTSRRPLKSLTEMLSGKDGRFRQNLLGKRVDYSGRGVIVAGPQLRLDECGLPRAVAEVLFRPHVQGRLTRLLYCALGLPWPVALRAAHALMRDRPAEARRTLRQALPAHRLPEADRVLIAFESLREDWLRDALADNLVLLNRAPSLHRLSIQAFRPVLSEDKTIRLHPLVCAGFAADFDGDTMAVHLPLSRPAQDEAARLMRPLANLLSPANGRPNVPSNEIVLGCCYLTQDDKVTRWQGDKVIRTFASRAEVILAHALDKVRLHEVIRVRLEQPREILRLNDQHHPVTLSPCHLVTTTVGRVLFDDILPDGLPFHDLPVSRRVMAELILTCYRRLGAQETANLLDRIKELGFRMATRGGLSFVLEDLLAPPEKEKILAAMQKQVDLVRLFYQSGLFDDDWRYRQTVRLWQEAQQHVTEQLQEQMRRDQRNGADVRYVNPICLMAESGARGNWSQVRQLAAMRGLMARPSGDRPVIEQPITSSLRQGLSVREYWLSTHGARKAGADKDALPDSGYLTRRLIDVAHHVVVGQLDCGSTDGRTVRVRAAVGRVVLDEVRDADGVTHLLRDDLASHGAVERMRQAGIRTVRVRSPLTCRAPSGSCQLCYGADPATERLVELGAAVGVRAAQSIGEPGTQLAMKTKHTGGVLTSEDLVSGLERITALFEARSPRQPAILAERDGVVSLSLPVGKTNRVIVRPGQVVSAGAALTLGDPRPDDLLRLRGIEAVREWFLTECQAVYRGNGVTIDDKHFEVVLARTLARWRVEHGGDTDLLPGAVVDWQTLVNANLAVAGRVRVSDAGTSSLNVAQLPATEQLGVASQAGATHAVPARPARAAPLGLTRAALAVDSFLSAASFQNTSQVLLEAALAGKSDPLRGLKENVLLGRLIPAGSGFPSPSRGDIDESVRGAD